MNLFLDHVMFFDFLFSSDKKIKEKFMRRKFGNLRIYLYIGITSLCL